MKKERPVMGSLQRHENAEAVFGSPLRASAAKTGVCQATKQAQTQYIEVVNLRETGSVRALARQHFRKDVTQMTDTQKYGQQLADEIEKADAVLVGAAAGMSTASGFDFYYRADDRFMEHMGDFKDKYGFSGSFNGYYYPYPDPESRWAFLARSCTMVLESETGQTYIDIAKLLENRKYHVLTTNQDSQFARVMPEEKISAIQGDSRYLQCSRRCHDAVYDATEIYRKLNDSIDKNLRVPTELIPRCDKCGAEMTPWIRGREFLEGSKCHEEYRKVAEFLKQYSGGRILFLELGVGRMTPMFIQEPFWELTYQMPRARYTSINPQHAIAPREIEDKSTLMHADIAPVLKAALDAQSAAAAAMEIK